jgi:hypothetical protein
LIAISKKYFEFNTSTARHRYSIAQPLKEAMINMGEGDQQCPLSIKIADGGHGLPEKVAKDRSNIAHFQ